MNREQLLASLQINTEDRDGIQFDDNGRYIDWSCKSEDGVDLEVGNSHAAASIDLTWAEVERLHQALTLLLLERES